MIFFFFLKKKTTKFPIYIVCLISSFKKKSIPSQDIQILPYNNKLNLIKLYIKNENNFSGGGEKEKLSFNLNTAKMTTQ